MNYIDKILNDFNYDVNEKLKNEAESKAESSEKEIERLNTLIRESTKTINLWQNAKLTADKAGKAYYNSLIQKEKETLIINKDLLKQEKEKKKQLENTAKSYVEASLVIEDAFKENNKTLSMSLENIDFLYKIWLTNNENIAGSAEILAKETSALNEKLSLQKSILDSNIIAYNKMKELYGENHQGSQMLYNSLLEEASAYNKIAKEIENNEYLKVDAQRESIFAMNNYLKNYKTPLLESGFSEDEIYDIAKKVSGYSYDKSIPFANLPVKIELDDNSVEKTVGSISQSINADPRAKESYQVLGETFASSLGDGFIEKFKSVAESMALAVETHAKDTINTVEQIVYNTTNKYNFTTAPQTIFQQIEDTVRAEELKKARGI